MNKYIEAWNSVYFLARKSYYYNECDYEDIKLIQELVEKAIPIKFVKSYSKYGTESWLCPNCRRKLKRAWQHNNNYCPKCGQMIDFSEEK